MAKCDIQSAFRLLPVHPSDFELLGFKFEGSWYVDKAMPMGCSVACATFEAFSTFIEWVVKDKISSPHITHYLDDYLIADPRDTPTCAERLRVFQETAAELGVPLAEEKTEGPATRLTFLGIQLDTVQGMSSLPRDKLATLKRMVGETLAKEKCTLKQFQTLLGHLNFACRVVSPGRAFCARLARATAGVTAQHHYIRISKGIKQDLGVWLEFLDHFNGVSMWQAPMVLGNTLQVNSDVAGSLGFGIFFNNQWCAECWPDAWERTGILRDLTFLELFPIVVATCGQMFFGITRCSFGVITRQ